jgi:ABC-type oligopeptide transport system ATPase subunit
VKDFLVKNNVTTIEHSADFYLFPRLKSPLNGRYYCDVHDIIKNATKELKRLSQNESQECFQRIYSRWQKCKGAQRGRFGVNVVEANILFCISQKKKAIPGKL